MLHIANLRFGARPLLRSVACKDAARLQAVLAPHGLADYQLERLLAELGPRSPEWLEARLGGLAATVGPSAPMAQLLYNGGLTLLEQDTSLVSEQLHVLREMLPGVDVLGLVSQQPALLALPDLRASLETVLDKLLLIYPYPSSDKMADVLALVQDAPELLLRMRFHCTARVTTVEDLP
ncbi:hypothetical protein QJQ45_025525, partial [Haematococcus lacustris]